MQGRVSVTTSNVIQEFPINYWRNEFAVASKHKFSVIEWTIDRHGILENPILTADGQREVNLLRGRYSVAVPSVTLDFAMQMPFWKQRNKACQDAEFELLIAVIDGANAVGAKDLVLPIVDNGALENEYQLEILIERLSCISNILLLNNQRILFEVPFEPSEVLRFIRNFDERCFGINYDVGNSASLGYDVAEEFNSYYPWIKNIHIKDRVIGGASVPLGAGNANFEKFAKCLKSFEYSGNLILQTARAEKNDVRSHVDELLRNRAFFLTFMGGAL